MSYRQTGLNLTVFNANSTDLLATLQSIEFDSGAEEQDGRGIGDRYDFMQTVKQGMTIRAKLLQDGTGQRATNLDITVFTLGVTSYLGDGKSGTLRITNKTKDGSGWADRFKYPDLLGTSWEWSGSLLIPSGTVLQPHMSAHLGALSAQNVVVAWTVGSLVFSSPAHMKTVGHKVAREDFQTVDMSLSGRGTPTNPSTGSLIALALLGTGACNLYASTGAGKYGTSGTPLAVVLTEATLTVNDGAIVETDFSFEVQSTPTIVTS